MGIRHKQILIKLVVMCMTCIIPLQGFARSSSYYEDDEQDSWYNYDDLDSSRGANRDDIEDSDSLEDHVACKVPFRVNRWSVDMYKVKRCFSRIDPDDIEYFEVYSSASPDGYLEDNDHLAYNRKNALVYALHRLYPGVQILSRSGRRDRALMRSGLIVATIGGGGGKDCSDDDDDGMPGRKKRRCRGGSKRSKKQKQSQPQVLLQCTNNPPPAANAAPAPVASAATYAPPPPITSAYAPEPVTPLPTVADAPAEILMAQNRFDQFSIWAGATSMSRSNEGKSYVKGSGVYGQTAGVSRGLNYFESTNSILYMGVLMDYVRSQTTPKPLLNPDNHDLTAISNDFNLSGLIGIEQFIASRVFSLFAEVGPTYTRHELVVRQLDTGVSDYFLDNIMGASGYVGFKITANFTEDGTYGMFVRVQGGGTYTPPLKRHLKTTNEDIASNKFAWGPSVSLGFKF